VNSVVLAKSTDGGRHWSTPQIVDETRVPTRSAHGQVTARHGRSHVLRLSQQHPGTRSPTDVWLTHSHDGGATVGAHVTVGRYKAAPLLALLLSDYQGSPPSAMTCCCSSPPPKAIRQTSLGPGTSLAGWSFAVRLCADWIREYANSDYELGVLRRGAQPCRIRPSRKGKGLLCHTCTSIC
jgi:hypothetical protein